MARFNGTNGDDAIDGTNFIDIINGRNGNDTLRGLDGADYIHGGNGDDEISGGDQNDLLIGHLGNDTVTGDAGNDVVFSDLGAVGLAFLSWWRPWFGFASGGDDLADGGAGNDFVFTGAGNDEARYGVTENAGATDHYAGGRGVDTLTLDMELADWFRIDVQTDIADYLTFLTNTIDPISGEANGQNFSFTAFGLVARQFEAVKILVDGEELSAEDDPVTANDDSGTVGEDAGDTALGNVLTNDDVPDLTYQVALVTGVSKGLLTFNAGAPGTPDGSYSFDPNGEFEYLAVGETEDVTFTYEVTDADRDTDQATVTITVEGANDAPVGVDDSTSTGENTAVTVDVLANDTDVDLSDTHTVDAVTLLDGGTGAGGDVSIVGNQVHWDPGTDYDYLAVNESTEVVIGYDLSDNNGGTSSAELTVTVTGVNDAPVGVDDSADTDENTAVTVDVLANDTDVDLTDTHVITGVSVLNGGTGAGGDVSIVGNQVHWDPGTDYDYLAVGESTEVVIGYDLSDNNGGTSSAELTITVNGANDAPVGVDDSTSTDENTAVTVDVLANDTDVDLTDTHTVDAVTLLDGGTGAGGDVSIVGNQLHWDPGTDYDYLAVGESTEVVIGYDLSDNNGGTSSAELTITVNGVNDAPTANDDGPVSVDEDSFVDIDVLANDTDPDSSDTLTPSAFSASNGTVTLNGDGTLRYTPDPDYSGPDVVSYTVSDGNGGTDTATVAITVDPVNDAPTTTPAALEVDEDDNGGIITIDLNAYVNDVDPGDILSISNINISRGATLIAFSQLPGGVIEIDTAALGGITLDEGDVLTTQFSYQVMDDSGAANDTATGTVDLTINGEDDVIVPPPVNTPPVANALTVNASEGDASIAIALSDLATDAGDTVTITAVTADQFDGILTNRPVPFRVEITDGVPELILEDPSWFFLQESTAVDPAVAGDGILSDGEVVPVAVTFTVTDSIGQSDSNVITLNLSGIAPEVPDNIAPTAANIITPPGETPQTDPFDGGIVPSDVIVGETSAPALTIDLDDFTSDPDGDDSLLTFSFGDLVIGTDEGTGTPITAPFSFDAASNVVTIPVDETFPLADGGSVTGTLIYTVSDGVDSTSAQITFNYINPEPPAPDNLVLDFEPFSSGDGAAVVLDTVNTLAGDITAQSYEGFVFQGTASVIETDELGGGGRGGGGSPGIASGQTTVGGDNVLLGGPSQTEVPAVDENGDPILVQATDGRGNPLFDEGGNPVLVQDTAIAEDILALLAPGSSSLPAATALAASFAGPGLTAADLPLPNGIDTDFDLDGLSLNVAGNDGVTVTMTTYRYNLVETPITASFSSYEWVLATDTFEFTANASTPAELLDFNDPAFADDAAVPNTDGTRFDDILAVSFETDDGSQIVLDDLLITI